MLYWQPVQWSQDRGYMFTTWGLANKTCSNVLHTLNFHQVAFRQTKQEGVAVIKFSLADELGCIYVPRDGNYLQKYESIYMKKLTTKIWTQAGRGIKYGLHVIHGWKLRTEQATWKPVISQLRIWIFITKVMKIQILVK